MISQTRRPQLNAEMLGVPSNYFEQLFPGVLLWLRVGHFPDDQLPKHALSNPLDFSHDSSDYRVDGNR